MGKLGVVSCGELACYSLFKSMAVGGARIVILTEKKLHKVEHHLNKAFSS